MCLSRGGPNKGEECSLCVCLCSQLSFSGAAVASCCGDCQRQLPLPHYWFRKQSCRGCPSRRIQKKDMLPVPISWIQGPVFQSWGAARGPQNTGKWREFKPEPVNPRAGPLGWWLLPCCFNSAGSSSKRSRWITSALIWSLPFCRILSMHDIYTSWGKF